jgi:hypothetical protein
MPGPAGTNRAEVHARSRRHCYRAGAGSNGNGRDFGVGRRSEAGVGQSDCHRHTAGVDNGSRSGACRDIGSKRSEIRHNFRGRGQGEARGSVLPDKVPPEKSANW